MNQINYLPPLNINNSRVLNTSLVISLVMVIIALISSLLLDPVKSKGINTALSLASFAIAIFLMISNIRAHREIDLGGYMPYGRGLLFALFVGLIVGLIMGIFYYILYAFINPGLLNEITNASISEMEKQGMSEQQIEATQKMMVGFRSPVMFAFIAYFSTTLMFIFFGLIISAFLYKWPRPANTYVASNLNIDDNRNEL